MCQYTYFSKLYCNMQNQSQSMHADKVNVLPIECHGNKINSKYHVPITSNDMEYGIVLTKEVVH